MNITNQSSRYCPAFLNISGRRCVVVGGGQVALRKVKMLLEHGGNVEVISPDLCSELNELVRNGEICTLHRHYQAGDLQETFITIAATDDKNINLKVAEEARRGAVLVNVVDDADNSDFIVPSYLRRGDVAVAVSTSGRSPALARKIRTRLEKDFADEYATLALLIDEVRTEMKQQRRKVEADTWQEALDLDLLIDLLKSGDNEKAKATLLSNLKI